MSLFDIFPETPKEQWIKVATKDLRGADFNEKLVWKTAEGLDVQPFYTLEDLPEAAALRAQQNSLLNTQRPELSPRTWVNCPEVLVNDLEDANKEALFDLENGAEGLLFVLNTNLSPQNMGVLLKGILLNYCAVFFRIPNDASTFVDNFIHYADDHKVALKDISGGLLVQDPLQTGEYGKLFKLLKRMDNFRLEIGLERRSGHLAEQGGHLLANVLKAGEKAAKEGISALDFFQNVQLSVVLENNYFFEIARLRALRLLTGNLAQQLGATQFGPADVSIHAYTSIRADETTLKDPYTNMLSNTNQAMSAILGGCNVLTVLPHNKGIEAVDEFSRRIARNVSTILKEESYFDRVADPVAGSFYLETLTDQLAEKMFEALQKRI